MSSPSTPENQDEADALVSQMLADDAAGESRPGWRLRASGGAEERMKVLSETDQAIRYISIRLPSRFTYLLSQVAQQHGYSREAYIRRVLAQHVSEQTGDDMGTLLIGMPMTGPRREGTKRHA